MSGTLIMYESSKDFEKWNRSLLQCIAVANELKPSGQCTDVVVGCVGAVLSTCRYRAPSLEEKLPQHYFFEFPASREAFRHHVVPIPPRNRLFQDPDRHPSPWRDSQFRKSAILDLDIDRTVRLLDCLGDDIRNHPSLEQP